MDYFSLPPKLKMIVNGIRPKLERGEVLDIILASYTKLNEEERILIRDVFA